MALPQYIFSRYRYLLSQQDDFLIKTRIKLLLVCLLAFIGLFVALSILYLFQDRNFLLYRAVIYIVLFSFGLSLLLSGRRWNISAHFFIICLTLLIWSNVMMFSPGLNIVTIQFSVLVLAAAYYILGAKWGIIYSLVSTLPIIGDVLLENYTNYDITLQHLTINGNAFTLTSCFNFSLLIFIHYSFFRALRKSTRQEINLRIGLQKALADAEELSTAKTNFLTTMSHELRTPLNAMIGMTNILLMENPKPAQKENLNILRFSADNLMATVNDILDFNKINNEKITLEKQAFQMEELIANIMGTFKPAAKEKHLELDCHCDPDLKDVVVLGDPMRLTQILFHLVGNAIKFTSKGYVMLTVGITGLNTKNVSLHFSVADSGIGIPEELQSQIFEPFSAPLSRTSRQFHGTLGLTIAFHLVKLHNSQLSFKSQEGLGTKFEFEVSYPAATMPEIAESPKAISAIAGMRVLVVEDEKLNILVIKKILANWGITPDVAMDGQKAIKAVIENDYDVILMDINKPIMDGFEAAKQIRQLPLPHKTTIPIIAVTASIGAAIERVAQYPFIDDCLLKPFNPEHLREKLMEIAGRNVMK
ncbi:ATP-binding protein [Mucilaginibacter sp. UYCu711]|uniref:ATP-binding protein n=1 Tax=Mucilaginibacter sp. UYCu711 TaxID=3156339 RepID=UPI003D1E473A